MLEPFRFLLFPFSWIYSVITWLRNLFFDLGIFPSKHFEEVAVISVGNLIAGGTGKSPQIEYLLHLLEGKYKVATLSRGYGRKSTGFKLVNENSISDETGDEPLQFKRKFPTIPVAVDVSRVNGIKQLMKLHPDLDVVLLDDAFQHRYVKSGLSILLTDNSAPYYKDHVLPYGMLREAAGGAKRADIIVVTKTPENMTGIEKRSVMHDLKLQEHQKAYFSFIKYEELHPVVNNFSTQNSDPKQNLDQAKHVILLSGIANPKPLEIFLRTKTQNVKLICYPDHHEFTVVEMMQLKEAYEKTEGDQKFIITTEKDTMRLKKPGLLEIIQDLPVYYLSIHIDYNSPDKEEFNKQILEYVKEHTGNRKVHST